MDSEKTRTKATDHRLRDTPIPSKACFEQRRRVEGRHEIRFFLLALLLSPPRHAIIFVVNEGDPYKENPVSAFVSKEAMCFIRKPHKTLDKKADWRKCFHERRLHVEEERLLCGQ